MIIFFENSNLFYFYFSLFRCHPDRFRNIRQFTIGQLNVEYPSVDETIRQWIRSGLGRLYRKCDRFKQNQLEYNFFNGMH